MRTVLRQPRILVARYRQKSNLPPPQSYPLSRSLNQATGPNLCRPTKSLAPDHSPLRLCYETGHLLSSRRGGTRTQEHGFDGTVKQEGGVGSQRRTRRRTDQTTQQGMIFVSWISDRLRRRKLLDHTKVYFLTWAFGIVSNCRFTAFGFTGDIRASTKYSTALGFRAKTNG